ncbi:MAG: hypothetical protein WDN31_11980 [Hyphomicrobium sp.]
MHVEVGAAGGKPLEVVRSRGPGDQLVDQQAPALLAREHPVEVDRRDAGEEVVEDFYLWLGQPNLAAEAVHEDIEEDLRDVDLRPVDVAVGEIVVGIVVLSGQHETLEGLKITGLCEARARHKTCNDRQRPGDRQQNRPHSPHAPV